MEISRLQVRVDIRYLIQKHYKFILGGLAVFVFLLGSIAMRFSPINLKSGQTTSWWEVIENVERGRGYKSCQEHYVPNCKLTDQYTAVREPLPVFLFALVGWLTQDSVAAFQFIQVATVLLILLGSFLFGREVGGLAAGLLTAMMWALYLPAFRLETQITGDLLEGMFIVFGCVEFARVIKYGRTGDWLAFGFLFGLAALSRSAALILLGALGLGFLVYVYFQRREPAFVNANWFKKAVMAASVFFLVLSPWVIRNWLVFNQPIIGTTLPGYVLYRHNALIATDAPPHYVGADEARQLVKELVARRPEMRTPINEAQMNSIFFEEIWVLIKSHPFKYLMLSAYRFIPLWFNIGVDASRGENMSIWDYLIMAQQVVLLIIFILGFFKYKGTNDLVRITGFGIAVYFMAYLAVDAQIRYTIPVVAEVMAIGALGLLSILPSRVRQQLP